MNAIRLAGKNSKKIAAITADLIKAGKVLVYPTDTIYGLICDATNKKAVEKIFKIKQRPKSKPLPIFVSDIKMAKKFAKIDKKQEIFLRKVWPGKITVILKPKRKFPKGIGKPKKEIGLRTPKYRLLLDLVKQLHGPLAQTSVNISGQPPMDKIKEIINHFQDKKFRPDLIIDAGNLPKSRPSKIIDLTVWLPKILRS